MEKQNFKNHRRLVPAYHFLTFLLILSVLTGSLLYLYANPERNLWVGLLFFVISLVLISIFLYARGFALKAQDRAIKAEENFRHYLLTRKPLPSGLSVRQIVALRFASDAELPALAEKAAAENLSQDEIKKAIKEWRGDYYRV